jgi:hypothetical protein
LIDFSPFQKQFLESNSTFPEPKQQNKMYSAEYPMPMPMPSAMHTILEILEILKKCWSPTGLWPPSKSAQADTFKKKHYHWSQYWQLQLLFGSN